VHCSKSRMKQKSNSGTGDRNQNAAEKVGIRRQTKCVGEEASKSRITKGKESPWKGRPGVQRDGRGGETRPYTIRKHSKNKSK